MFTPVEDYMLPIRTDFAELLIYLHEKYNAELNQEHIIELKLIHKLLWILIVWRRYLESCNYYDDVVLNVVSLIHVSVHKDINIMSFLLRKSIEDFLRFMGRYIIDIQNAPRVADTFELALQNSRDDEFIHSNWERLKSIYAECCQTVHSNATIEAQSPCMCLIHYDDYYSIDEMRRNVIEWTKTIKCFCNILIIIDIDLFKKIPLNDQAIIRDFIVTEDLKVIFNRL